MESFVKIPLEDINLLLRSNNQNIPEDINSRYLTAYNFLMNNPTAKLSDSIIDWQISQSKINKISKIYSTFDILNAQTNKLEQLSMDLSLPSVNKERILRILDYMNKLNVNLDMFELLPEEVIYNILSNLDCKTILLMCKLVKNKCRFRDLMINSLSEYLDPEKEYTDSHLINLCKSSNNIEKNKTGRIDLSKYFIIGKDESVYIYYNKTLIPTNTSSVKKIFANDQDDNAIFLRYDGKIYVYGNNEHKQLGLPEKTIKVPTLLSIDNIKSVAKMDLITFLLTTEGDVYVMGTYNENIINVPTLLEDVRNIVQITSNKYSVLFLDVNGNVYGYGKNIYGELGYDKYFDNVRLILKFSNIKQIELSNNYGFILKDDGQLYVAGGKNTRKYISRFTYFRKLKNVKHITVGNDFTLALTENQELFVILTNLTLPQTVKDILQIYKIPIDKILDYSLDYDGVYILTNNEDLYVWGFFGNLYTKFINTKLLGSSKNPLLLGYNVISDDDKLYVINIDDSGQFKKVLLII